MRAGVWKAEMRLWNDARRKESLTEKEKKKSRDEAKEKSRNEAIVVFSGQN